MMIPPDAADHGPLGEPLVDAATVAAFLRVDVATVHRLAGRAGGLPSVEIGNRIRRFRPQDVRAYVEQRTQRPVPHRNRASKLLGSQRA